MSQTQKRRVRGWKIMKAFFSGQPCVKCGSTDYEYRRFSLAPKGSTKRKDNIFGGVICEPCEEEDE